MRPYDDRSQKAILERIQEFKRRRIARALLLVLALAVTAIVYSQLILPAVTKEVETLNCQLTVHTHTDGCRDQEGNFVCGYADFVVHTHNEFCYSSDGGLICPLPEIKTHTHDESCYQDVVTLICGQQEAEGHTHSDACYESVLICPLEETVLQETVPDIGDGSGTDDFGMEVMVLDETVAHTHDASCYESRLICPLEESAGHVHTDACFQTDKSLICLKEEIILHTHTEACCDENGYLICGQREVQEHVHNENCVPKQEPPAEEPPVEEPPAEEPPAENPENSGAGENGGEVVEGQPGGTVEGENGGEGTVEGEPGGEGTVEGEPDGDGSGEGETDGEGSTDGEPDGDGSADGEPDGSGSDDGETDGEESEGGETDGDESEDGETEGGEADGEESEDGKSDGEESEDGESDGEESEDGETDEEESEDGESDEEGSADGEDSEGITQDATSWATVEKESYEVGSESMRLMAPRTEPETGSIDFYEHITHFDLSKIEGGVWVPIKGEVVHGDMIKIHIDYSIPADIVTSEHRRIHYQLPDGVKLKEPAEGAVMDGNARVGRYTISTDGLIQITFNTDFATDGEAFSGELELQGQVAATGTEDEDKIDFGEKGETIIVKPDDKTYDIGITKTGTYDKEAGVIKYTVTVFSDKGTDGPVQITDRFLHQPSYGIIDYQNDLFIQKKTVDGTWSTVQGYTWTVNPQGNQAASFEISELEALGAGESYILTYTAKPDLQNSIGDGDGYLQFSNEAMAMDKSKTAVATANVKVSEAMISKTGSFNAQTNKISWTITLNKDRRDIGGLTLTDDMIWQTIGQDAHPIAFPNPVTLKNVTSGGEKQITIPHEFDLGSNDTYEITYEIEIPEELDPGNINYTTFTNYVKLGEYKAEFSVYPRVEGGYGVVKYPEGYEKESGLLSWSSVIKHPANADTENIRYVDGFSDLQDENGNVLADSHYVTGKILEETLQVRTASGTQLNWYGREAPWSGDYNVYVITREKWKTLFGDMSMGNCSQIIKETDMEAFKSYFADMYYPANSGWKPPVRIGENEPLAAFMIVFEADTAPQKIGNSDIHISYCTQVNQEALAKGEGQITALNVARIKDSWSEAKQQWGEMTKLNKQVSAKGPEGNDASSFTDDQLTVGAGDTNGLLYYRIMINGYSGDGLTVTDTLPKGATLVLDNPRPFVGLHSENSSSFTDVRNFGDDPNSFNISQTPNEDGTTTVKFYVGHLKYFYNKPFAIYYSVSIADDPDWKDKTEKEYTNKATWNDETDSTSTKVQNTKPRLEKVGEFLPVDKNEQWATSDLLRYYITVNPAGEDLNPFDDVLTLEDTLKIPTGSSAPFLPTQVKLYQYDSNNKEGHYCGNQITPLPAKFKVEFENEKHTIKFTIPDGQAYVLVYDYAFDRGTAAGDLHIDNDVTLTGHEKYESHSGLVVDEQDSSASVNKTIMTFFKHDKDNIAMTLPGAKFFLHRYEKQEDGSYDWVQTKITAGDDGYFTTDQFGNIVLNFLPEEQGGGSLYDTVYRLQEVVPPDGYLIDEKNYYFVWMHENDTKEKTIADMEAAGAFGKDDEKISPDDVHFLDYSEIHTDYIPNERNHLTVTKKWMNDAGEIMNAPEGQEVTVTLYQWKNGEKQEYIPPKVTEKGEKQEVNPVVLSEENNWTYSWTKLPQEDAEGAKYTYTVEEAPLAGFEVTYSYSDGSDPDGSKEHGIQHGDITITNTQNGFVLPETGGAGKIFFIITGALLLGAAGVGYHIHLEHRRRKGGGRI